MEQPHRSWWIGITRVKWVACFWSHLFCVVEDACFAELFACEVIIAACGGILVAESVGIC